MKERRHNIKTLFSTFDDKICTLISIIWAKYFSSGEGEGGSVLRCTQPKYGQRKTEKYILCKVITGRNEVVAKVMFLHVCVILFTGGVSRQGEPPLAGRPPRQGDPPRADTPGTRPPPPGSRLQHTVYERPVRILLECILVLTMPLKCITFGLFQHIYGIDLRLLKVTLSHIRQQFLF